MREILTRTNGIGISTLAQVQRELADRRLVVLDVDFELPSTGYGIVSLRGRNLSPAARTFSQMLREIEAELQQAEQPVARAKPRGGRRRVNRTGRGRAAARS